MYSCVISVTSHSMAREGWRGTCSASIDSELECAPPSSPLPPPRDHRKYLTLEPPSTPAPPHCIPCPQVLNELLGDGADQRGRGADHMAGLDKGVGLV